jgi:hypothetical protein
MAGKGMMRIGAQLPDPFAQHILVQFQVACRLSDRDAPILHKPHCLKLELARKLPSLHVTPPVP